MSNFDKQLIAKNFSAAASHYDRHAFIQRTIGDRLFERLELMSIKPKQVLDVGCGTGHYTQALLEKYPRAKVFGIDLAEGMISAAKQNNSRYKSWFGLNQCEYLVADMDKLPFADQSVDLVFSNLAFQWSVNPKATFQEFVRVLKPNGLLMYSTLGPDTLKELRSAWQLVDQQQHVNQFIDMH
ncbi:MAG: methyltransferase domain-containing protein, partial [Kangiellaceae bacterium]|nr:methyltransferase domain-containing protein [Kangiellaceae bacterium]